MEEVTSMRVPFKKVVLAACGGESCQGALRQGVKLAKQSGATLIGVSVVLEGGDIDELLLDGGASRESHCEKVVQMVRARAEEEGVACEGVVRHDQDASAAIADVAHEKDADIIVMGRRDRSLLEWFIFGSVTGDLVGRGDCCVMTVPQDAHFDGRHVLLATDGGDHSVLASIHAEYLAKLYGAELTVLVVGDEASRTDPERLEATQHTISRLEEWSRREGVTSHGVILFGDPAHLILHAAKERNVDMIVVGSRGRTGLSRIFKGSVSETVVAGAECPVLVVRG